MTGYLMNFVIYTIAMIGVIFIALYTFKFVSSGCLTKKSSSLKIEDTMKLSARKSLYIIKAENEKFLIAADLDSTSLIARLGCDSDTKQVLEKASVIREDKSRKLSSFDGVESMNEFASIIDFNNFNKEKTKKGPIMRELARKLNTI